MSQMQGTANIFSWACVGAADTARLPHLLPMPRRSHHLPPGTDTQQVPKMDTTGIVGLRDRQCICNPFNNAGMRCGVSTWPLYNSRGTISNYERHLMYV